MRARVLWVAVALLVGCGEESSRGVAPPPDPEVGDPTPAPTPDVVPDEEPPHEVADLLHAVETTVTVSSAFHGNVEQVAHLYDGDLTTAWNSETDNLRGAWIEVELPADAHVDHLEMTSGFTHESRGRDLFEGNHRVRRVRVTRNGTEIGTYSLNVARRDLQRIDASGAGGTWRVELVELVPGLRPTWREACVSELEIVGSRAGLEPGQHTPTARISPDAPVIEEAAGLPEGSVNLLRAVPTTVRVTSALDEDIEQIERLVDGDLDTAWRSADIDPARVAFEIELPPEASVSRIEMTPSLHVAPDRAPTRTEPAIREVRVIHDGVPLASYELHPQDGPYAPIPALGSGGTWRIEVSRVDGAGGRGGLVVSELRVLGIADGAEEGSASPTVELVAPEDPDAPSDGVTLSGDDDGRADADPGLAPATDPAEGAVFGEAGGLRVTELSLGSAVESRQIQDARQTFSRASDTRIYCLVRVENPEREATGIYMAWERVDRDSDDPGRLMNVPASPRYVTFGMTGTRRRAGRYRCAIRTESEELLGSIAFDLEE